MLKLKRHMTCKPSDLINAVNINTLGDMKPQITDENQQAKLNILTDPVSTWYIIAHPNNLRQANLICTAVSTAIPYVRQDIQAEGWAEYRTSSGLYLML